MTVEGLESEALRINLETTRVEVHFDPKYEGLREAVGNYSGLLQQTEALLAELNHPYRNWGFVVRELRRYALTNYPIFVAQTSGPQVCRIVVDIFLEALARSQQAGVKIQAADNLILFLERLVHDIGTLPKEYGAVLSEVFTKMHSLAEAEFFFCASSYYPLKKMGKELAANHPGKFDFTPYCALLGRALATTYDYWLEQEDPLIWFRRQASDWVNPEIHQSLFLPICHERLQALKQELGLLTEQPASAEQTMALAALPNFMDIVQTYRKLPDHLGEHNLYLKVLILYKMMETKGLESIHEETLREINYSLGQIIGEGSPDALITFLERTFAVLNRSKDLYPEGALSCVLTIGREVFKTGNSRLIDHFLGLTIAMGFETPKLRGMSTEWQLLANPVHLHNIRNWLELVEQRPREASRLLSALIVNLSLGGVCIRDTDLFQKDVSRLLNSPIRPLYNLVKQLAKIFPVYFNEIGAEGHLRDVSTEIDEVNHRKDPLIHFLRKLSHVESNNTILDFIRAIVAFWRTRDRELLSPFLPDEVFRQISASGTYVDEVHEIFRYVFEQNGLKDEHELLDLDVEQVARQLEKNPAFTGREKKRALLLIEFYQLLAQKYQFAIQDIIGHLERGKSLGMPDPNPLIQALKDGDHYAKLDATLDYLRNLKEIIFADKQFAVVENIYRKRHIAADIPSMYGTYHELKFDALGLTFRLENLGNTLFEDIISRVNLSFLTLATFFRISKYIKFFIKALELDGIKSRRLEKQWALLGEALEIRRFSYSQYIDVFRGFSEAIRQIINIYYHDPHQDNLALIIDHLGSEQILTKYQKGNKALSQPEFVNKISETFLRDLVARTFGLQCLDNFISRILNTLTKQQEMLQTEQLDLLMSYDSEKALSSIRNPNRLTHDLIHLGNKGYNLVLLAEQGIPVPPGFIVTTEVFRCRPVFKEFDASYQDFLGQIEEQIANLEEITGCNFGSTTRPLLLSVRSGAAISMPGMMNTFLNVGINEDIVEGLIQETGEPWFAWDSYRRFLQSWGMAFGMERDTFDSIMNTYKERYDCQYKRQFTSEQMRELARAYRGSVEKRGVWLTDEPLGQLHSAIGQVKQSWFSRKAKTYREIMGISENWGTAVTVQAMVYGNLDSDSGAGVVFTHNPRKRDDRIRLWGDFTLGNQGEDVVAGLVKTLPISEEQKLAEGRDWEISLESQFPEIFHQLQGIAEGLIYDHGWGPQEIEFAFQSGRENGLFILQARDMQRRVTSRYPIFAPTAKLKDAYLGSGIGVSGGALSGRAVFNLEEIERYRREAPGEHLILVRSDTVPDDIKEISAADGILSGRGGATSHAAIVAYRLEKTCVVGCVQLRVWETASRCLLRDHEIRAGDIVSIDGRSGSIYRGGHPITTVEVYQ